MRLLRLLVIAAVALPGCRTARDTSTSSPSSSAAAHATVGSREFSEALAHYSQALLYEHDRPPRLGDALEHHLAASRADPSRLEHFLKTAELQYRTGDIHATVSTMRSAVSHHPESYDAHIKLAAFAQIAGKPQLASKACARAIRLRPTLAMPSARLAFLLLQRDAPVKAMQALDRGLKATEDPVLVLDTYPHVANVLRASGFTNEANACLVTVAAHRPENLQAREQLLSSYLQLNQPAKARAVLSELANDTQYHPAGYSLILAELHERVGDRAGAIRALETVDSGGQDPKASLRLAILYVQTERNQEAIEILKRVAEDNQDHPLLFALMGEIYEKLDQSSEAIAAYEKACRHERPGSTPHLRLALLYLRVERRADATRTLSDAMERFPDDPDIPTILGWMHFVVGSYDTAIKHFEEVDKIALRLKTSDKDLHDMFLFWFASACERDRQIERSEKLFRRCIEAQPDNHQAYNYVAYMWAELNQNLQEAHRFVLKALEQDPSNAAYIDTLGWIYYRRNEHTEAEREIRRALEQMPEDPTILEHLGDVLDAQDRAPHARKAWEQSFLLNPANESLANKLREHGVDPDVLRQSVQPRVEPETTE